MIARHSQLCLLSKVSIEFAKVCKKIHFRNSFVYGFIKFEGLVQFLEKAEEEGEGAGGLGEGMKSLVLEDIEDRSNDKPQKKWLKEKTNPFQSLSEIVGENLKVLCVTGIGFVKSNFLDGFIG